MKTELTKKLATTTTHSTSTSNFTTNITTTNSSESNIALKIFDKLKLILNLQGSFFEIFKGDKKIELLKIVQKIKFCCPFDVEIINQTRVYYAAGFKFDDDWKFYPDVNLSNISKRRLFIKKINNSYYSGGYEKFVKQDFNGRVQVRISFIYLFHGLTHEESTGLFYVITEKITKQNQSFAKNFTVFRYNTRLDLVDELNFENENEEILCIRSFKGRVYAGVKTKARILVFEYNYMVGIIETYCKEYVTSMNFDSQGFMIIGCFNESNIYLHHTNRSDVWKSIIRINKYEKLIDVIIDKGNFLVVMTEKRLYRSLTSLF